MCISWRKKNNMFTAENKIVIAIDGHSSCGKSTIARDLAKAIGYTYIDTGAMYRAVTLFILRGGISLDDEVAIAKLLKDLHFEFCEESACQSLFVNGENVEKEIRKHEIADLVSPVSEISQIRKKLVAVQREMGQKKGSVLEGRDIGTVVFPEAELKFFITADIETRAARRFRELRAKGIPLSMEKVINNLSERDRIDSSRIDSPLKQAPDAIFIDTSKHNRKTQLEEVLKYTMERISALHS